MELTANHGREKARIHSLSGVDQGERAGNAVAGLSLFLGDVEKDAFVVERRADKPRAGGRARVLHGTWLGPAHSCSLSGTRRGTSQRKRVRTSHSITIAMPGNTSWQLGFPTSC
jgi:hypothetical protein